jgi:hypothetical protein
MLDLRGVLKPSVDDGSQKFRFQEEILESRSVNTNIVASASRAVTA